MHGQEATKPRRKLVITRKRVLPDKTKTDAIESSETAPALKMIMQDSTFDIQVEKSEIAKHFREENEVGKNFGTSNKTEPDDNEDRTEENLIEDGDSTEETSEDEEDQPSEDEEVEDEDEYLDDSDDIEDENEFEESPPESLPAYEPFFPEITETTDVPVLLLKTTVVSNVEFETKTLTTTRLRTYTFVVTTVAGTDEIVTSTTEVKPQIKTTTVTESLTQYTTLTLLDLDKTDVQPTFLPTLEHNPSSLSNTEDFREEPRNLATRVMSNGVEVIVAGDKTTYPGDKDFKRVLPSTLKHITLKPTTVSDHMLLVLPQETANIENSTLLDPNQFVVKTCLTTFTYLTTYLEKGTTTVSSHEQVVSNVATEERMNTGKILPTPAMGITLTQYPTFSVGVFHTTYTYLNTILDGEQPLIISSQHVVANTVTAPDDYLSLLKPSEVQVPVKDTNTYISTIDLEKTLYEGDSESVISTRDVVTQVVITESVPPPARPVITSYTALDSLQQTPLSTTDVTKTYFVTYTYYNTVTESGIPTIFTNVSTESDVVTEKLLLSSKKSTVSSSATFIPEFDILATRIYYTTFTYFTTLLKENDPKHSTIINSRTKVIQNTVTETLEPSLFDPQYISSLASDLKAGSDRVQKIATLIDGEKVEITVQPNEVHNEIAPTKVLPIEKTQIPSSLGMTSLEGSFSSKPNIVTGSTIVFVDDDPFANLETPILQTTKSSVKSNLGSLLASEVVKETKIDVVTSKVKRPAHKSKNKPKVNASKTSVITTASSNVMEKNSNFKTKKGTNKSPNPAAPPQDLLGLGSINMNTLQALTPVLNAMAGYLNKNLRRNDINITAGGDHAKEPSNKKEQITDTQNRSPVYIPVGGALGDEFEIAESQNIATFEWKDPPNGVKQEAPLLGNNGIPISPGDIITANSDVIVGKPGRVGPRLPPSIPLHQEGINEIPMGMRPPPLPEKHRLPLDQVPAQTNVIHAPNKDDYIGPPPPPLSRPKEKFRGEKRKHIPLVAHSQQQHVFGPQQHPLLHPQTHPLNQQQQQESAFQGGLEIITSKYHLQTQNQNPIYPLVPSVSIVLPEVIERSTGQPLLVQLQPSQVAFVNIPFNRTTALIYGGSTETHHNGQYFDDPSPYPEPEFNPIEGFKNGLPQYGSTYHTTPHLNQGNQKQVSGVIKVGPYVNVKADPDVSSNEKVPVRIEPTRLDFAKGDGEVSVGVPPLSFGVTEQDGDMNAHIINHENFNLLVTNSSVVVPLRNEVFHIEYPEQQQILNRPMNQHFQEDVKFPNRERPYFRDEPRPSNQQQELSYPTEMTEMRPPSQHYSEGQHNYHRPAIQQQQGANFPVEPKPSNQYGAQYPERLNQQHYDSELRPPLQQDSNYSEDPRPSSQQNSHYATEIRPPNQQDVHYPEVQSQQNYQTELRPPIQQGSNYPEKSRPSNQQNPHYLEGPTQINQQNPHKPTRLGPQNKQNLHYHDSSSNQQDLDFLAQMRPPDQQPQSSNHPEEPTHYPPTQQHTHYPEESRPSQNPHYEESRPSNPQRPRPHQDQSPAQQRPHPLSEDQKHLSKSPSPNRPNKPKYPYPPKRNLLRPRPRPDRPKVSEFMTPPAPGKQYYSKRPSSFKERLPIPLFEVTTHQPPRVNLNKYHQDNRFKEVTKDVFILNDHHEDDLVNEDGEVIQESNARPLRPGELPLEVLHKTTTTERVELVRFPDSFQNATQVRFPYDRRPGFVELEKPLPNPAETNYGPVYYGEKESQTEKNDLSFLTFNTRNTTTEKPIIIFIDENGQKTDSFPKKSTGNRSKVTSLPIDTLTTPTTPSTSTQQSQTEKPFDFPPQQSSNQVDIKPNAKIGVTTPEILLNSGENFGVHLPNLTQQINDMEILHPPPLIAEEDSKTPSILMEPPKIDISSPGKDIIQVPHTDPGETDQEESSNTLKPFIPKPSEEMVPPAPETTIGTTEIVLGMNPPPLVSTHKPVTTSSNVFSMEVDVPSTTIRNKVRRPGYRPITTSTRRPLKTRKPSFVRESSTSAITPTPTLKSTTPSMEVIVGQPHFDGEKKNESKLTTSEGSLSSSSPVVTVATPNEDIITKPIHHAGNEVKIVDEPNKTTTISANKPTPALPTRYITYTKTHTVTITKTTVVKTLGGPPSTMTILVTKTEKSYIVDTVTEFHTLIKPTSIVETVTTTVEKPHYSSDISIVKLKPAPTIEVPQPTVIVSHSSSKEDEEDDSLEDFIIKESDPQQLPPGDFESNESIFVVMTDKNKGTIVKMPKTTAPPEDINDIPHRDEITDSEASNVLLGGVLIAPINEVLGEKIKDRCNPECKASRNELCQKVEGMMRCVCRPGFARMFPDRPCNPTYTYSLNVTVEKIGKTPLKYRNKLSMENSTEFMKLSRKIHEALDRMVMQSDLRDIFHGVKVTGFYPISTNRGQTGVVSKFYLQLSDNIDETRMEDILKKYLRNSNSSLGGTDVFASSRTVDNLKVQDFNECENSNLHDCSENAKCFNLRGSYTCSCKEGYSDLSENMLYPGRLCSSEQVGCEKCNYHGMCYSRGSEEVLCECFHWYAGDRCQINLKVMLIALVTLGTILFALLMVCIILTCVRRKPKKSGVARTIGFLPQRGGSGGNRSGGTLDRRAMIEDTSSEDSRSETNSVPPYVQQKPAPKLKPPPAKGALKKASMTSVEHSEPGIIFPDQKDRSLTVMIPRAKYHPAPPTPNLANYTTFDARKPSVPSMSSESKLLSYLDAGPSPQRGEPKRKPSTAVSEQYIEEQISSRKTSGALISAGFEVSATVVNNMGTLGTTCGTEADRSENATLIQKISADLLSRVDTSSQFTTLRKALDDDDLESTSNWLDIPRVSTVSESRSYDETTIPPPMKSFTRSEYDTKSLQHQNDEANTMAERDLGSTFLLPHTHLYKPDRGSDISGFESL
ncbi:mucin-2-like isoform X2 [Euwallacea similis]|uniref:mucin-2-like isoform X2 n=1 Tax=Euwallacea similis TaxID=1736056 RepID=UPI00344B471B